MACILLLEDDPALNRLMTLTLESAGYEVSPARDAATAFDHLPDNCELILLDINVPGMDGPTFLAGALAQGYQGKVVVVSGDVAGRDLSKAMGADAYLAKPFNPDKLLELVGQYVRPTA